MPRCGDVGCSRTRSESGGHRGLDRRGLGLEPERMPQQERGAEDGAAGVGDATAGDVRRRAVDWVRTGRAARRRARRTAAHRATRREAFRAFGE
jgi:hypothetical protein